MSHKYEQCGHVKIVVSKKDHQLHAFRCTLPKRHEAEDHENENGDRWRA